jgi:hypothetical protein
MFRRPQSSPGAVELTGCHCCAASAKPTKASRTKPAVRRAGPKRPKPGDSFRFAALDGVNPNVTDVSVLPDLTCLPRLLSQVSVPGVLMIAAGTAAPRTAWCPPSTWVRPPPSPCNYLWLLLEAQSPRHSLGSPVAQAVVRPTRSSSRHSGCSVALQLGQCSRPVNLTAVAPRQARSTLTYGSWGCAWPSVTTVCCTRASSRTGQTSLSPGGVLAVHHLPPHHSLPTTYLSTTRCPPTHQV